MRRMVKDWVGEERIKADIGFIGGSGTYSLDFPEALEDHTTAILKRNVVLATPCGPSPPLTLFYTGSPPLRVLAAKMHGRIPSLSWGESSQRLFHAFMQAGVQTIIAEGGVGSVNHLLDPLDIVVPTDYIDFSMRRDVSLQEGYLSVMREPICPSLHTILTEAAKEAPLKRVFDRGIYVVTDGRHFESAAEVNLFRQWGADIVGQTLCPEVYLARECGACYAGIYLVVNYGEGVLRPWEHKELEEIFFAAAPRFGQIILTALKKVTFDKNCHCASFRYPTILTSENIGKIKPDLHVNYPGLSR